MGMPNSPGVKLWHVAGSWNWVLLMMLCEFRFLTHWFLQSFFGMSERWLFRIRKCA